MFVTIGFPCRRSRFAVVYRHQDRLQLENKRAKGSVECGSDFVKVHFVRFARCHFIPSITQNAWHTEINIWAWDWVKINWCVQRLEAWITLRRNSSKNDLGLVHFITPTFEKKLVPNLKFRFVRHKAFGLSLYQKSASEVSIFHVVQARSTCTHIPIHYLSWKTNN